MATQDAIEGVLVGLLRSIDEGNHKLVEAAGDSAAITAARDAIREGDVTAFYFAVAYPMGNLLDGLLAQELCSPEAQFLFRRGEFVESHFRRQIELYEGSTCCADKTGAIIEVLLNFFRTGQLIEFDYEQQYTYHLPKKVFTTHESIVGFFYALRKMYHGQADDYLAAIAAIRDTQVVKTSGQ